MAQRNTLLGCIAVKNIMYNVCPDILKILCTLYLNFYLLLLTAAETNALNKGCGVATVLLYSGWYCTPI